MDYEICFARAQKELESLKSKNKIKTMRNVIGGVIIGMLIGMCF
jgi:hypothetical protein